MNVFEIIRELKNKNVVPAAAEGGQLRLIGQIENLSDEFIGAIKLNKDDLIEFLQNCTTGSNPIPKTELEENYALSNTQLRIWILCQSRKGCIAYNIVKGFHIQGSVDRSYLEEAFSIVIKRHESLRTIFRQTGDEPRQFISANATFNIQINDSRERYSRSFRENNLLEGYDIVDLPYDYSRPQRKTFNGGMSKFYLGQKEHETIVSFCKENNLSVFNLLTGALILLIYKL